ncbi:MAG: asparagine synthase (glutamine-hydrolyzing) [Deltaproteobacteria bacterium RIFCSPLOWO2_02_FULL_46_8]|nr:MAG: asparagine synthase (glutamine-hydrolyzing) [Deltaproteobacteria bacterium RIFCSPLOWO2_02_FULL_46_8]
MCGIAGIISSKPLCAGWAKNLQNMEGALTHRGPDDFGYFWEGCTEDRPQKQIETNLCPRLAFAHRRLSILDLSSAARQPLVRGGGKIFLTYNGEIYNFKALREELRKKGAAFHTQSDTEVLLEAYRVWGIDCVKKFRGIFAFALADLYQNKVFLARDHLGVKPLYYLHKDQTFYFASEMKAFLKVNDFHPEADFDALSQYLHFLWIPGTQTGLKNVAKLEPGTILTIDLADGSTTQQNYWSPITQNFSSHEDGIELLRSELKRAVQEELVSDVPLGAFLSGGLDSSLVTALMGPAKTFSVGYSKEDLAYDIVADDLPYARKLSKTLQVDNHEILLSPNVSELLPKVVWHLDEPVGDPAAISSYLICETAKQNGLTVMLSGMGGDELFAGYPRQKALKYAAYFRKFPHWFRTLIDDTSSHLPAAGKSKKAKMGRALRKFLQGIEQNPIDHYISMETYFPFEHQRKLVKPEGPFSKIQSQFSGEYKNILNEINRLSSLPSLKQALLLDLLTYLPCLNLAYTDKTSMAHSVEVRVPLLDIELVHFALARSENSLLKWRRGKLEGKWLLKKAAEPFLPKEIIWRKKAGFGAPVRSWLRNDLKEMRHELLGKNGLGARGWFQGKEIKKIEEEFLTGKKDHALKLWMLMSLELWAKQYLDYKT